MDKLRKERSLLRTLFTKAKNSLNGKLEDSNSSKSDLRTSYNYLLLKSEKLFDVDERIKDQWLDLVDLDECEFETDCIGAESYRYKWEQIKVQFEDVFHEKYEIERQHSDIQSIHSDSSTKKSTVRSKTIHSHDDKSIVSSSTNKRHFRLPKIELKKFDGNVRNWIGFWGQFKKIDNNDDLDEEDKFQYLLQSTVPGTTARELVESFPPSGNNYTAALKALKDRFARDELLIEIYVRELLNLVLMQVKQGLSMTLSSLYDKVNTQLRALESLGVTSDKYAAMLYPLVESAIPEEILRAWERQHHMSEKTINNFDNLLLFLKRESETKERIKIAREGLSRDESTTSCQNIKSSTASCLVSTDLKKSDNVNTCIWCDKNSHSNLECYKAARMSLQERVDHIKTKKGCLICLKMGHWTKKCKNFPRCLYCKKRHVILMCSLLPKYSEQSEPKVKKREEVLLCRKEKTTLLQTLLVEIYQNDKVVTVRALIDNGAQRSFIKKNIATEIGFQPNGKENISHGVFGGMQTKKQERFIYTVNIRSTDKTFNTEITVIEEDNICGYITKVNNSTIIDSLKNKGIILTELTNDCPDDISLLIGADFCGLLLTGDFIQVDNNLTAIRTKLGWTLQGVTTGSYHPINSLFCMSNINVTDMWSLETLGIKDPAEHTLKCKYDENFLNSFKTTIKVNVEGRYEVNLPWRDIPMNNYDLARKRLDSTTKRLQQLNKIKDYDSIFREWFNVGIIEQATTAITSGHYLPHHAVIKDSSLTTKIRPVFDASAKDKYGISLNSCLEKGVNLIELIPQLLIDFRKGAIGVTSDIVKAFLQISVEPGDSEFLKFMWWSDPSAEDKELVIYQHRRVVFGLTSSPFHLAATLSFHLENAPEKLQLTAKKLLKSFYVDNCVTSVETEEELNKFVNESKELMYGGMFDLRGWTSAPVRMNKEIETVNMLGIVWNTETDELQCNISLLKEITGKYTKRNLLSITHKIFDPIGILCPTTIIPKMIMQKSWLRKLSWDEELPTDLSEEFLRWLKYLPLIKDCKISRRLAQAPITNCKLSIHVFCDASKDAYATCIYLRSEFQKTVTLNLVLAKSRVTPAKIKITIPRLELIATLMGTRLCIMAKDALKLQNIKTYYWTDSSVALSWIKGDGDWSIFVSNRVREIMKYSSRDEWNHVPGHLNPADLPSRGINAKGLMESRWWEGPSWLRLDKDSWPITDFTADTQVVNSEQKKNSINTMVTTEAHFVDRLAYFSSYTKIVRMIGWILRFKGKRSYSELSYNEIERAEIVLIKLIQDKHLQKLKDCKLQIFKDSTEIFRLKTKLDLGDDTTTFKSPIVLFGNEPIVQKLVEERHKILQHAGTQTIIVNLRETYWIIGIRRLVKRVVNSCITCKRYKVKSCQTLSIGLPVNRIKRGKAFEVTGIDLAGPLLLRSGEKCWIILFTCAIYRAVHMELVMSLSTDAFMMGLRRFIARRGRIHVIYTDNGTNFIGARNKLNTVDYNQVMMRTSIHKINWRFIPPGAPWWGGWWERLVGVVKQMLRRIVGRASLDYIELETVLCECESIINQRPLTYVSGDDENLKPLTPAMFLQPLASNEVSDLDNIDAKGLNIRLKYLQKLKEDLRQRFRNEYLSTLIQKGRDVHKKLSIGDIVLVEIDGKRVDWPLGLIVEMIPGVDGICRVAKVKTSNNEKVRPVQKLYPLEICSSHLSNSNIDLDEFKTNNDFTDSDFDSIPLNITKTTRAGRVIKLPSRFGI